MRFLTATCLFVFTVFFCAASYAFDCGKLDFGAKLTDLDDGNFVLYRQADGVSYYNYVGSCRLQVHQNTCPAISYAFVDGKYYAMIIKMFGRYKKDVLNDVKAAYGQQIKVNKSGGWTEYRCKVSEDVELKIKCNDKTREVRSAAYSVKLREQLARNLKNDPVNLAK